ncbi:FkbM family methyltransferase [Rhizobium sp. FKL33]|uniref:FkbM family methyltransferase n=1 Tax=Rhizobium sp. FKL33 TaxID=2562307 RepID=UPI0010C11FE2|nr:FkbM family methyltransferase [Rhizobium sp. FKL33]
MTPDFDQIAEWAGQIRRSIPEGVLAGAAPSALYGYGFLGCFAHKDLQNQGVRLSCAFDGKPELDGQLIDGLEIRSPARLGEDRPPFVFVSARHAVREVSMRLDALGIAHVSVDAHYVARDIDAYKQIHDDWLTDDRSRETLRAVMATMLTGDKAYVAGVFERDQYFCLPQFCGSEKEIYVDAGAYVGDSLERFLWSQNGVFHKALCFEPGMRQFRALANRRRRLISEWALDENQIAVIPAALGETDQTASAATSSGDMTSLALSEAGEHPIKILSLDAHLAGERVSMIKADVEGMEMALLNGAAETIRRHRPKLAICVYHYPSDIPVISRTIKSLVPDYRFALRHHSPQFMETVLYAWVET